MTAMTTARTRRAQQAAAEKVVAGLRQQAEERTPEGMRELAGHVIGLRQCFEHDGMPDWGGRSQDYRDAIYQAYKEAGAGSDSAGPLQANLRYHIGNVLREIAPPEDLQKLGMDPAGPRERAIRARATAHERKGRSPKATAPVFASPFAVMSDPLALASFALDAVKALRALEPRGEMAEALRPLLRQLSEEVFDAAGEIR
jgi:hypothetical protein